MEVVCYVGWLKVGSALINPFGDDDEDFEIDELIERNLEMGLLLVEDDEIQIEDVLNHPNLGSPNIVITADWWETNWMLDIGREPLRIRSVSEANGLEKEAVKLMLSGENSNLLTVPGEDFQGIRRRTQTDHVGSYL